MKFSEGARRVLSSVLAKEPEQRTVGSENQEKISAARLSMGPADRLQADLPLALTALSNGAAKDSCAAR